MIARFKEPELTYFLSRKRINLHIVFLFKYKSWGWWSPSFKKSYIPMVLAFGYFGIYTSISCSSLTLSSGQILCIMSSKYIHLRRYLRVLSSKVADLKKLWYFKNGGPFIFDTLYILWYTDQRTRDKGSRRQPIGKTYPDLFFLPSR